MLQMAMIKCQTKSMKRFIFGYDECTERFWENATSIADLVRKLNERGMEAPDWIDPCTTCADSLPRSH